MHISIEGQQVALAPYLLGRIAERLQRLAVSYETPFEAHIMLTKHELSRPHPYEVQVLLILAGGPLYTVQRGATVDATVEDALQEIAQQHSLRCSVSIARCG